MKQSIYAQQALEYLKATDGYYEPVLISEGNDRVDIALIHKSTNSISLAFEFLYDVGLVRVYPCMDNCPRAYWLEKYEALAKILHSMWKHEKGMKCQ